MVEKGKLIKLILEETFAEYEHLKPYGADVFNALDVVMYDLFGENEPEGIYEEVEEILKNIIIK